MNNPEKFLKMMSTLIETGVLTSQDLAKGLLTSMKFNREKLANKLDLVTREEFTVLKKIIEKQQKEALKRQQQTLRFLIKKGTKTLYGKENSFRPPQ